MGQTIQTLPKRRISTPRKRNQTTVVLSDAHVPFHSEPLFKKICAVIHDLKPDGLVLAGDFLDLFSLSSYAADSVYQLRDVTLDGEYKAANKLLDMLGGAMPTGAAKHYLWGNHEDRYWRELKKGDRGKYGTALLSPNDAMRLNERGYEVLDNWQDEVVVLGDHLEITHGLWCNKYAAAKHLDEFQGSVMFGHTHRMQSHFLGKRAAFNIGCTCDIESKGFAYMPRTQRLKWSQGFAIVRIDDSGDYHTEMVQSHAGVFYASGRRY